MGKGRLEAFSDGVIAIIITIMVLEMKVPHGEYLESIAPLWPVFVSYVLSFVIVAIYWNNHHHMLHSVKHVTGAVLWSNAHLLFWLSLMPFTTGWMGENHFAPRPVALYGVDLLMCAIAYFILVRALIATPRPRFGVRGTDWIGLERQGSAARLCRGHRLGLHQCVDFAGAVRGRGGDVVHSRSAL